MKLRFTFLLILCGVHFLSAQSDDSLVIKQVDSLIQVSQGLTRTGDFDKALFINAVAEKLAMEEFGGRSATYGFCAFNRGRVNYYRGNFMEAEKWYLESISIQEEILGVTHPATARSLNALGLLYIDLGQYEKAEPLCLESKAIRQNVLGREHPDYVVSLRNLGMLYQILGNFEESESCYLEAKDISEITLRNEDASYAGILIDLGHVYTSAGQYEKAEPLFLEAIDLFEDQLNDLKHPFYVNCLTNLAVLYKEIGNYEKSESLCLRAKDIRGEVLGKEHPHYASSLDNLANLYAEMQQSEKAELLYLEAKEIFEKTLGKEHPQYATVLINLGTIYYEKDFAKAESLYLEALEIYKQNFGNEHPYYAGILSNLANLYQDMGNVERAEKLQVEAKEIREKTLGLEHPEYGNSLILLAYLYELQARYGEAEPLLENELRLSESRLIKATSFLSEHELAKYTAKFQNNADRLSSYLLTRLTNSAPHGILPGLVYNSALFYKGFLLTAASKLNHPLFHTLAAKEVYLRLKTYRRRLATEYAKPLSERAGVAELEEKAVLAEKELTRSISGYGEALRRVSWQDVQKTLAMDEIALEFIHFQVRFPTRQDSVMYAVVLIRPGTAQPLFIPLFEEKELDHLLSTNQDRKADYVNALYTRADRGLVEESKVESSLYTLIWKQIESAGLEGVRKVYYSPSGILHRLNLGAIAVDDETILSDHYNVIGLNSTRQLVIPSPIQVEANDAVLVGGVNFEVDPVDQREDEQEYLASRSVSTKWADAGARGGSWTALKWTEKEVERISASLTVGGINIHTLTGMEASEKAIKSIGTQGPSPRVVHLATHGFFFPDPEIRHQGLSPGEAEPVFKLSDNPMIRSGLILAGGNYAWQHGLASGPEKEDGILTAYEISQMNLANTELVVLSACETGLGDIQGNEGVYGLQRAFKIAGAKYLIMSLWQVPDRETMEFMTAFYRNWLEPEDGNQVTIPEAFRKTQLEMRDRFFNPFSWAGFVLVE